MTESEMIDVIRQRQDLSLDQQAAVLGICRSRVIALRQKYGLSSFRRDGRSKAELQRRRIVQILEQDGPQSARALSGALSLKLSDVHSRLTVLKREGTIQYAAKIGARNGLWKLCAGASNQTEQLRAPRSMHSLPLNRLPEYFGRQPVVVDQ